MRATSNIITLILVSFIVMSSVLLVWVTFNVTYRTITMKGEPTASRFGEVLSSCMSIESVEGNKIYLRNCGTGVVRNDSLKVFLDDEPLNFTMSPSYIEKSQIATVMFSYEVWRLSGNHKLRITSSAGLVERYVKATLPDSAVLVLDFDEGSGNIAYDSSGYGNNGDIHAIIRNRLNNPSFENDKQDWGSGFGGDWDIVTDIKYHDSKSSRFQDLVGNSESSSAGYVRILVTPGQSITISVYSKGNNVQTGSEPWWQKALIIGRWEDSNKQQIDGLSDPYTSYPDLVLGDGLGTWDWKRTYATYLVPPNAAYYRFSMGLPGDTTGTLWVDAVQIENGTKRTPFRTTPWVSGKSGYALLFNGIDDYVEVGDKASLNFEKNDFTVDAWIKVPSVSQPEYQALVSKDNLNAYYQLYLNWGVPAFSVNFPYKAAVNWSFAPLNDNSWHYLLGSRQGDNLYLYVDGTKINYTTGVDDINVSSNAMFRIGARNRTIDPGNFSGTIYNVRVYNKALTPNETVVLKLGEFT